MSTRGNTGMDMEEEVICGYLVTKEKKQLNKVYLDLLTAFDAMCKRAGFTYWIAYGSLIGTIRHKGFIPWDDDVDILMPRKDLDRLLHMTNQDLGVEEPYFMQTPHTDLSFQQRILRFRRSDTSFISDTDIKLFEKDPKMEPYNMGIALAVFPLDNVPRNKLYYEVQKKVSGMGLAFRTEDDYKKKRPIINRLCSLAESLVPEKTIVRIIQSLYRHPKKNKTGQVQSFDAFYPDTPCLWDAEDFQDTCWMPFEDITVPVPVGYDHILSTTYGDYMAFPSDVDKDIGHSDHYSASIPYPVMFEEVIADHIRDPKAP